MDVMQEIDLPLRARELLKLLRGRQGKNNCCWPSQELIAHDLGIGVRQVQKWVAVLVEAGMLEVERTNMRSVNRYFVPPREASVHAHYDTNKSAPQGDYDAHKSAPHDTNKSAPQEAATLDELSSFECEDAHTHENTIPNSRHEHPEVDACLDRLHAFESLPDDEREKIEAFVRQNAPLYAATDDWAFKMECVAVMAQQAAERPWLAFKKEFLRRTGIDEAKADYLDTWEARFEKCTLEEMILGLDMWLFDRRRDDSRWHGRWPREAGRIILRHIDTLRASQAKSRPRVADRRNDSSDERLPAEQPVAASPECSRIADAVLSMIGESRFALWFRGKVE